ncbi:hypothetical protein PO124_22400 [Bacillus licheniformis]|nr:hypothetical protein [Bacillus licheniformis]
MSAPRSAIKRLNSFSIQSALKSRSNMLKSSLTISANCKGLGEASEGAGKLDKGLKDAKEGSEKLKRTLKSSRKAKFSSTKTEWRSSARHSIR